MSYAHDHRQQALKVVQLPNIISSGGKDLLLPKEHIESSA